jgi:hypothetical protein
MRNRSTGEALHRPRDSYESSAERRTRLCEFPLDDFAWPEPSTRSTWVQGFVVPPFAVDRPFALKKLTSISGKSKGTPMSLTITADQAVALLMALRLPDDTTDIATVLATVQDLASDEQSEGVMAKPSAVAAAAKRHSFEVVEAASLESLRREATEGRPPSSAGASRPRSTTPSAAAK